MPTANSPAPVKVAVPEVAIAAGAYHSVVLKSDGTVFAWGNNNWGQTNVPAGLSSVVAIAAGGYHSLALKADGTVVAWGFNGWGQTNVPAGLSNVVAIAAAGDLEHGSWSLAIKVGLRIAGVERNGDNSVIRFPTLADQQYAVQCSPGLSPASWYDLPGGGVSGDGHMAQVADTNAIANAPVRFYRLRLAY